MLTAGIDEAGRGPLAGPVVAAAVIIPDHEEPLAGLADSKQLTAAEREELYVEIVQRYAYGIGIVPHDVIDQLNILQATFQAMREAVEKLNVTPQLCLVDGNKLIPKLGIKQKAIVKGDAKIPAISAASIIAKVTRDRMMYTYDMLYPEYKFAEHKGYGTAEHIALLEKLGPSPIHRKSFKLKGDQLTLF